jgi:Ca2+ transporting ATPase
LGRSTPEDKYMLVLGLRDLGSVVAVTGDGTNDAPALKKADVGFAMGIAGTEVAKEAADIILLDDNFQSIVTAVKWGRNIFSNVRKFLQFQLVINIGAILIMIVGTVAKSPDAQPLDTLKMLWINLLMDTFAALALATEDPSTALLAQMPYTRDERIITPVMWRNIFGQVLYQLIIIFSILFAGLKIFNIDDDGVDALYRKVDDGNGGEKEIATSMNYQYTLLFHSYVFMQVFNEINARKLGEREFNVFKGFFDNFFFLLIIIVSVVVQVLMVEFGGRIVKVVPLDAAHHFICIGIGAASLPIGKL